MFSKLNTCVLQGLNGYLIDVETDLTKGLPSFNIVGLPDTAIKEAKERVRASIKNSGFEFPLNRITINLAPANFKKAGSQIDIAIATGILLAVDIIKINDFSDHCFLGELSLDGKMNKVEGALPMTISLKEMGIKKVIIPLENKEECSIVDGIDIIPVSSLSDLVDYLNGSLVIEPFHSDVSRTFNEKGNDDRDFKDVKGQNTLKRAMEVAAAGAHNILIIGPPGSGKTMVSRRIPSILPRLTFDEALEITKIYSVAGLLKNRNLMSQRPFRAPHHTISKVSLVGGGRIPNPGEVSLAHYGVLFLDELPEFNKSVLEVLRQPMEDGEVTISRVNATLTYPAKFMLVASMNPCPCGYYGDPFHECSCTQGAIDKYLGKISGPLLDRFDIHIEVMPVKYEELENENISTESSAEILERVDIARKKQIERYKKVGFYSNEQLSGRHIKTFCQLDQNGKQLLKHAFDKLSLSARAYNKILKVARTIADLDNKETIQSSHIAEAIQYRSLDRKYWA